MYKIGDRIEVMSSFVWDGKIFGMGYRGKIKYVASSIFYGVEWETNISGHDGGSRYRGKLGYCWDINRNLINDFTVTIEGNELLLDFERIDLIHCDSCNKFLCIKDIDTIKDSDHADCYTRKITNDEFAKLTNKDVEVLKLRGKI